MTKNLDDILSEVKNIYHDIKMILSHADYENYDDLSGLEIDSSDPEQLFILDELQEILSGLDNVSHNINYLLRPIKVEGILHKKTNGRYEISDYELSSGHGIEYLANDARHMRYDNNDNYVYTTYWKSSRIEHDGKDYYIVGANDLDTLEGVRARIR
jgi:hypothetical protein